MEAGRPTDYTPELAKEICETIASTSEGLKALCKKYPHWPVHGTIYLWLRKYSTFSDLYAKAKRDQVAALVDEIIEISDDTSNDTLTKEDRNGDEYEVANTEWIARSRLRVDTRKWIAAKLVPRLYGDNALARELADEIEEFRKKLGMKPKRNLDNGNTDIEESEEDTEE
jgi:hypothetical protein